MVKIKTWAERCEDFHPLHVVTRAEIKAAMQGEINDLRAEMYHLRGAIERHRLMMRDGKPGERSEVEGGIDRKLWEVLDRG